MKKSKIIANLLKEGFSEKTLLSFTDKQLLKLHERVVVKAGDLTDPKVKTVVDKASADPRNSVQIVKEKSEVEEGSEEEISEMFRFKDISELAMDNLIKALENANINVQGLSDIELETVANDNLKIPFINAAYNLYTSIKDKEKHSMDNEESSMDTEKSSMDKKWPNPSDAQMNENKNPKKWIQKAIHPSKKGSLKKALGVKKDEKIPAGKLKSAAKKGGKLGQRARFAMNVKKLNENGFYPLTTKNEILEAIKDNIEKIQKKKEEKPKIGNIFSKKKKDMNEAEPMVKPQPTTVPVKEPGTAPKVRPSHPGKRPLHAPNPVPKAQKISATDAKSKIIGTIKNILKNG